MILRFFSLFLCFCTFSQISNGFHSKKVFKFDTFREASFRDHIGRFNLEDVERLAKGKETTGGIKSRQVRHKLMLDEVDEWTMAKVRRYLIYPSKEWHPDRTESPLSHSFRLFCDSLAIPFIKYEKAYGRDHQIKIDLSTLRTMNYQHVIEKAKELARMLPSRTDFLSALDIQAAGLLDLDLPFKEYPIWMIPDLYVEFRFKEKRDAFLMAEKSAAAFAFPPPQSQ
jgi:hypothetical protein